MSSTNTASDELSQILTEYCQFAGNISVTESVENLLTQVSEDLRYELLSAKTDDSRDTVLAEAAWRGHTELCVTLLSSLPSADRLKLILVNKRTALHAAAYEGYTETISGILNCLTAEQQVKLLSTENSDGKTALHYAAHEGHTDEMKTLIANLTPEQQLKLLSVKNTEGKTASQHAEGYNRNSDTITALEKYQIEADYRVFGKFASLFNNF